LAFSADSLRLVVLHHDGALVVWDLKEGTSTSTVTLKGPPAWGMELALSADGSRVATLRPPLREGRRAPVDKKEVEGEPEPPGAVKPGQAAVWDARTGERVTTLKAEFKGEQFRLALSPNGKRLAIAESPAWGVAAELKVWDADTGAEAFAFTDRFDN